MKTDRLAPYILVSVLIHAGVLIGAHQFLELPVEELESVQLVPVEVEVIREDSRAFQPGLALDDRIWPKRAFQTKSQAMMETTTDRLLHEMTRPIPKASRSDLQEAKMPADLVEVTSKPMSTDSQDSKRLAPLLPAGRPIAEPGFETPAILTTRNSEPRMDIAMIPTLKNVRWVPRVETIAGKPIIPVYRDSSLDSFPVDPSPPPWSSPVDTEMPTVPAEAKASMIPAYSQIPKKIETPLASRRRNEEFADGPPPMPREETGDPVLMTSTLKVHSQPNGAQVYVNGLVVGETPLAWELPIGKHEVRLALPDYYDWKAQIELTEKHKTLPVFFRLLPVKGIKE